MSIALLLIGLFGISTPSTIAPTKGGQVAFVQSGDTPHLLIERRPGGECAGAPDAFAAHRGAVQCPTEVDAGLATRWIGRTVELYGGVGKCTAEVVDLHLLTWFDFNFHFQDTWFSEIKIETLTDAKRTALLKAALAQGAADDRFLAAALKVDDVKACDGARWARTEDTAPPKVEPVAQVKPQVRAAIIRRLRAQDGYRAIQERYRAEADMAGIKTRHWDAHDGGSPSVRIFETGKDTYVYAGASVGGCGDFTGDYWIIWKRVGRSWVTVSDADQVGEFILPQLMIDGDAGPLFADHTVLIAPSGPVYEVVEDVDVGHYICPC